MKQVYIGLWIITGRIAFNWKLYFLSYYTCLTIYSNLHDRNLLNILFQLNILFEGLVEKFLKIKITLMKIIISLYSPQNHFLTKNQLCIWRILYGDSDGNILVFRLKSEYKFHFCDFCNKQTYVIFFNSILYWRKYLKLNF